MNGDTIRGEINSTLGEAKEGLGKATGDTTMQAGGVVDQVKGAIQKTLGARDESGQPEIVGKARQFAKDRPWATAALAGVVGMAILNTLRGRR